MSLMTLLCSVDLWSAGTESQEAEDMSCESRFVFLSPWQFSIDLNIHRIIEQTSEEDVREALQFFEKEALNIASLAEVGTVEDLTTVSRALAAIAHVEKTHSSSELGRRASEIRQRIETEISDQKEAIAQHDEAMRQKAIRRENKAYSRLRAKPHKSGTQPFLTRPPDLEPEVPKEGRTEIDPITRRVRPEIPLTLEEKANTINTAEDLWGVTSVIHLESSKSEMLEGLGVLDIVIGRHMKFDITKERFNRIRTALWNATFSYSDKDVQRKSFEVLTKWDELGNKWGYRKRNPEEPN